MAETTWLDNINLGNLGAAGLLYSAYTSQKNALGDYGKDVGAATKAAMTQYMPNLQFKPFTVTTGTGGTVGYKNGSMTMQLSPEEQALQGMLMGQAQQQYQRAGGDISGATADYYQAMRAASAPGEERDRLALEERLAAQGRLGVQTAQYGGTPEQLAMAKAQQEARSTDYLKARQAALGEQQQAATLGQSMFTQAYLPQAQQMNAYQQALSGAQLEQQARQQYGLTGMETSLSAEDARLQAMLGQANLTGGFMSSLAGSLMPAVDAEGKTIAGTGWFGDYNLGDIYNYGKESGWW